MGDEYPPNFVKVASDGLKFEMNGSPFYFSGANCYYMMTRAADPNLRHEVTEVLDAMRSADLTVLRTWAFCDGPEWNALQPEAGVFDERVFAALDWVIAEAGARGIRLSLPLVNYWPAYGGIPQYVRWSCQRRGVEESGNPEDFYGDHCCQDIFQNFLVTITSRINTITNTAYRDDPTIMAWELMNEPRSNGDFSASKLQAWIEQTAEFLKSIDPHHLVTVGSEGFFGSSTPEFLPDNPFDTLTLGCDFVRNHAPPDIDFCSIHLWPDSWLPGAAKDSEEAALRFARRWINAHVDACCSQLGKPLVLAEFGKKPAGAPRAAFYQKVHQRVQIHAQAGHSMAGSLFWCLTAASYPDYDGFKVLLKQPLTKNSAAVPAALVPKAKPGILKRKDAQQRSDSTDTQRSGGLQQPSGSREEGQGVPSTAGAESGASGREQQPDEQQWEEPESGGRLGVRRVSSATETNCSAAAAMFDAGDAGSAEEALLLDAATVSLIVQHAHSMQLLNGQHSQRICVMM